MKPSRVIVVFTALLLAVAALYFVIVHRATTRVSADLPRTDTLTVAYLHGPLPSDPDDATWASIAPVTVHLFPQSARPPYGRRELDIEVKGAFDDSAVAFRLDFPDGSETRSAAPDPDACAILLVPASGPAVEQMMGHDGTANIWHWRADLDSLHWQAGADTLVATREMIAAGAGTQSAMDGQNVAGRGAWRDGRWTVAFRRALAPRQDGELSLLPDSARRIAFAVWDGGAHERFGIKSISVLRRLELARGARP